MGYTIRLRNFQGLKTLEWSPEETCLLVGANGTGKSTVIRALQFFKSALTKGISSAIREAGDVGGFCYKGVEDTVVELELTCDSVTWKLEIPIEGTRSHPLYGEKLIHDGLTIFDIPPYQPDYLQLGGPSLHTDIPAIQEFETKSAPGELLAYYGYSEWLLPFTNAVREIRTYSEFAPKTLTNPFPRSTTPNSLARDGHNLVQVLGGLKNSSNYKQFQWVLESLNRAFPILVKDLDINSYDATLTLNNSETLPWHLAPSGWIRGLANLTAVAEAKEGSLIALEELENGLHPHAIRSILRSIRDLAEKRKLTIILTTHSPILMNEFRENPEYIFVFEPGENKTPMVLTELHDEDWLAQCNLGDTYDRLGFASPSNL
jgi:predicted ATPase